MAPNNFNSFYPSQFGPNTYPYNYPNLGYMPNQNYNRQVPPWFQPMPQNTAPQNKTWQRWDLGQVFNSLAGALFPKPPQQEQSTQQPIASTTKKPGDKPETETKTEDLKIVEGKEIPKAVKALSDDEDALVAFSNGKFGILTEKDGKEGYNVVDKSGKKIGFVAVDS